MNARSIPVTELRRQISAVMRYIQETGAMVTITCRGRPAAVMLGYQRYQKLVAQTQPSDWPPGYFAETYGAQANDLLIRPEQGEMESREILL